MQCSFCLHWSLSTFGDTDLCFHLYGITVHLIENYLISFTENILIWLLKQ